MTLTNGMALKAFATAVAIGAAALTPIAGQTPVALIPLDRPRPPAVVEGLDILHVQGQVYMIAGAGANVAAQVGSEGVMVIDSGAAGQTQKIADAIGQLSTGRLRYMVNTSADPDHVAGNDPLILQVAYRGNRPTIAVQGGGAAGLTNQGAPLTVSHQAAMTRMLDLGMTGDAIPLSTFVDLRKEFFANGEAVQMFHQPAAHTDGDVVVFFRKSDVVVAGDVFVPHAFPVIDTAKGGTVNGVIEALNNIIDLTVPERNQMGGTRVIPGHGRIANESDVVDYRDMVTIVRDRVQDMIKKGMTLQQVRAQRPSLEYDGYYGAAPGVPTPDAFIEAVYRTLGGR